MFIPQRLRSNTVLLVTLLALCGLTSGANAAADDGQSDAGSWQTHQYLFNYMGFTSTYSCAGLADKLTLLLRLSGAREDAAIAPLCARGDSRPDKLAQAKLTFSSLQPSNDASATKTAATSAVAGVWRHVELAPRRPFDVAEGDCELIEQYRAKILPMFAVRNLTSEVNCVPNQVSNFSLKFDVFAPAVTPKAGKSG